MNKFSKHPIKTFIDRYGREHTAYYHPNTESFTVIATKKNFDLNSISGNVQVDFVKSILGLPIEQIDENYNPVDRKE